MHNSSTGLYMHLIVMIHLCNHFDSHISTFVSYSVHSAFFRARPYSGPELQHSVKTLQQLRSSHSRCTGYAAGGRVVFVNAELHTLAEDATPDFVFKTGVNAGTPPYCR